MVGYYYKTGAEIYSILKFMKSCLDLSYKPSPGSVMVGKMYADKKYRFSFFLNERKEIVYLIEALGDDNADYFKEEKPMTNMTKEEALKKIEELKEYVEKCEEKEKEIPEMPCDENSTHRLCLVHPSYGAWQECGKFQFGSMDTCACYSIKAFELAHLMYAREHLKLGATGEDIYSTTVTGTRIDYNTCWKLYFDKNICEYQLSHHNSVECLVDSVDPWIFEDRENALKVVTYMNKYVKDKVKELY